MESHELVAALMAALEALPDGVSVVDDAGRLVYRNTVLARLLSADPERPRLEQAIADVQRCLLGEESGARGARAGATLPRRRTDRLTTTARTHRARYRIRGVLVAGQGPMRGVSDALVVVLVARRRTPRLTPPELRERYGLTTREARVLLLLESGASSREIATALSISVHTARRHAEAILRKLGVHSRREVRERLEGSG